jgi:hypothetical protein
MMVDCYEWIEYSHWGMFRLHIMTVPDWFADGVYDEVDDDLLEDCQ